MDNKLILLVEDNPNDVVLTRRALKRANIANDLIVVGDGVEALEYLLGKDGKGCNPDKMPVVVLLDLKLPKVDGLEVLRRLRATDTCKLLPVVILTSSSEERDMVESYKLGANSYVRKPVKFDEFAEAVRQLGLYWLVLNQPPPSLGRS